ncbi:MAG TPA: methionine biosynthesis protein MetW [Gammaproteobacteria bacterium]|nr:methionine biosynthesis protein MetW [Gammaproteobacteria bacterium]MEC8009481.1 methionine biosynthesis protein MetW [Pseudomonadota bacterium]HBF08625.1 methionine biosynthesis protein MetW [Gammaproteobacteria bacterium]HCK91823.1 methionine biosynthesis protein MetW [Gammaproteobacteria bacterium]|tara:strand:- start:837 stop:1463 length:627 start_codon:yes stop_codon:yes gene_type:complete
MNKAPSPHPFNRFDFDIIRQWTPKNAHVLDLGCGDGTLLKGLFNSHNATGYGLETDEDKLQACVESGVPVIEQNIDNGLDNFQDQSFDTVIITQSIQELSNPRFLLEEIVRVGKQGIVTFPNFGYWRNRWMLATQGRMPESETIPHKWYSTPNIHLCTCIDFEMLCKENNIKITAKKMISHDKRFDWATQRWPNLFGELALYKIESNG